MKRVIVESPLGTRPDGSRCSPEEFARNQRYVLECIYDCLKRGEAGFGSHALYPAVLKDADPAERKLGMEAGFTWGETAQGCAVYLDYGVTEGMAEGIKRHTANGIPIQYRYLYQTVSGEGAN